MDWDDIWVAADPDNAARTANSLVGEVLILLARVAPRTPFDFDDGDYVPLARAAGVLDAIWRKHQQRRQDDTVVLVKSMERALDIVDRWFKRFAPLGARAVLAEKTFDEAATVICCANGCPPGGSQWRGSTVPTPEQVRTARSIILKDADRLKAFETMSHQEWLAQAAIARSRRARLEAAAEILVGLRISLENAFSDAALQTDLQHHRGAIAKQ